ncbi:MAG: hypothetical protein QGG40_08905, partial [Myxococcota bacterium]|nr:hypothetical protein [Myxococcota bacterium]
MERLRRLAAMAPGRSHGGQVGAHLPMSVLEQRLAVLEAPPRDQGSLVHLVLRQPREGRVEPAQVQFSVDGGLEGDRWAQGRRRRQMQVSA